MDATGKEKQLLDHLRRIGADPIGYYAVRLHLSDLKPSNRQPHFIRIAQRSLEYLVHNHEVALFPMSNSDFIVLCHDVPVDDVDPIIYKVRALFSEDPLTSGADGTLEDRFTSWYDLSAPADLSAFIEAANVLATEAARMEKEGRKAAGVGEPISAESLVGISEKVLTANVSDIVRQQPAVYIEAGGQGGLLFREFTVYMAALQKRVAGDVNIFTSPWLFQYLTEIVDRRMLSLMSQRNFDVLNAPISLNLNVSTILGRDFQRFHGVVGDNSWKVVAEFQLLDIFADINQYTQARDWLQENGYRVLIDGVTPIALDFFDPADLAADFVKINWGTEFMESSGSHLVELRDVVAATGRDRIILARTDSEDAIKWALGLGVTRFQGRYVDTIADAMSAKGMI